MVDRDWPESGRRQVRDDEHHPAVKDRLGRIRGPPVEAGALALAGARIVEVADDGVLAIHLVALDTAVKAPSRR